MSPVPVIDKTARLNSNAPIPMEDSRLMPQGVADKWDMLCEIRKTPMVLYGLFTDLTRQCYKSGDNLLIDVCATWDPDPAKTKIWIGTEYEWDDMTGENRPAIYIKLGELKYKSLTGRSDSIVSFDLEEGEWHFSRSGVGTVSWVHIGSTKGESVALAGSTLDFMDAFSMIIRDDLKFSSFEIVSLMPVQYDKESKERYRSVVTASFEFEDTWSIKVESPKLKRVVFSARQDTIGRGIF
jgi:hypothetical protein